MEDYNSTDEYCFVCTKCSKAFCFLEDMESHLCVGKDFLSDKLFCSSGTVNYANVSEYPGVFVQPSASKSPEVESSISESYIAAEVVDLNPAFGPDGLESSTLVLEPKDDLHFLLEDTNKEPEIKPQVKRKRSYIKNDYNLNKLTRDPYFKLDNNTYTFKDTLGDWDEKGTKLLIILMGRFPKAHFLLQYYFERRLSHWENIHSNMQLAGYHFTVLQLRMRWRELLSKYRKTSNHNDLETEMITFEYMEEMNELFGIWTKEGTKALLHLIEVSYADNQASRQKRLGFTGWERVTTKLASLGYSFGILQVEARWRILVTNYKSMIDHNLMPTVEPIKAAYSDKLSKLVTYEPRRRKDYEKYKGTKIKLEKFPEHVMKLLISEYSNNATQFIDKEVSNAILWDGIKKRLSDQGHDYSLSKLKEIFFAKLKLCERSMQHNAMRGAIRREGPHYAELVKIYDTYGYWPHVRRRTKTQFEKSSKRYEIKLRESMQTWHSEESRVLLAAYAKLLETFVPTMAKKLPSSLLWVELAQTHENVGYPKRATSEIIVQLELLRQGYAQGNNFPFHNEMKLILDTEDRIDFRPDMSQHVVDTQILYWSHKAVYLMLDLYLEIQPLLPYSSLSTEVYSRISMEMTKQDYNYTAEEISNEIKVLLVQYTMKRHKIDKSSSENWGKRKSVLMYKEKLKEVMCLRDKLSLAFTNGIRPISDEIIKLIYKVARNRAESLFCENNLTEGAVKTRLKVLVFSVRREIRKIVGRKPPVVTKICVQLLSGLSYVVDDLTENQDLIVLHHILSKYSYQAIINEFIKDSQNGTFKLMRSMFGLERFSYYDTSEDSSDDTCVLRVGEAAAETNLSSIATKELRTPVEYMANISQSIKMEPLGEGDVEVISLEEALSNYSRKENAKSLIFIDQDFGTKTTVQPVQENGVGCISFDDINVKDEPYL